VANPHLPKLGIIAGGGALPAKLVAGCVASGRPFYLLGLTGFANAAEIGREPDAWIRFGEAGRGFALMKAAGVAEIVMVGAVTRPTWRNLWPDGRTFTFFLRLLGRFVGDNSLLSAVIAEIEREGFRVVGAHTILTDLLAPHGVLGRHQPSVAEQADIVLGLKAARDLGRRDLGQAVIVSEGRVTAEEGRDGTDAMIGRAKGGILVKTKKPQQDARVDLPAVGVWTIRNAAKSGLRGVAVEAGNTLVVDREAVIAAADELGLFVVGVTPAPKTAPLIYLVACEPSGDQLGALLIRALREETNNQARIVGVGGPAMAAEGLRSLFDPAELALLGIVEVLPKAGMVLARVRQAVADIEARNPDVLVTIDSWGFTGRIHERLTKNRSAVPRVRYVAPQVWAWRPGRARQLARWIGHLMTLFPFEPPYFTRYGLSASWVGHPVLESGADKGDGAGFRARHGIGADEKILVVLPGSRGGEVSRLMGLFGDVVTALSSQLPNLRVVIPTVPNVSARVAAAIAAWPTKPIIVATTSERFDAFAAGRAALAASGTVSLELAMAGLPHVIAYRVNAVSAFVLRRLIRTAYVNLVNVLLNRESVPERLQENADVAVLTADMLRLLNDEPARQSMQSDFKAALKMLSPEGVSPSRQAARTVLNLAR
jgi:lipid-A-disaccharide synthase